jgi:hypothetical protein
MPEGARAARVEAVAPGGPLRGGRPRAVLVVTERARASRPDEPAEPVSAMTHAEATPGAVRDVAREGRLDPGRGLRESSRGDLRGRARANQRACQQHLRSFGELREPWRVARSCWTSMVDLPLPTIGVAVAMRALGGAAQAAAKAR